MVFSRMEAVRKPEPVTANSLRTGLPCKSRAFSRRGPSVPLVSESKPRLKHSYTMREGVTLKGDCCCNFAILEASFSFTVIVTLRFIEPDNGKAGDASQAGISGLPLGCGCPESGLPYGGVYGLENTRSRNGHPSSKRLLEHFKGGARYCRRCLSPR